MKQSKTALLVSLLALSALLSGCAKTPTVTTTAGNGTTDHPSITTTAPGTNPQTPGTESPVPQITFDETLVLQNYEKTADCSSLFYSNGSFKNVMVGDPFLYYDEDSAIFYLYGTTRKYSNPGKIEETFCYYTSKDMINWESGGSCFTPGRTDWCKSRLWAPEVYKIDGKYYMYYTAAASDSATLHCSVAVADNPAGPFTNKVADGIDGKSALFNFGENFPTIDNTLFIDDDGSLYMYFVRDQIGDNASSGGNNTTTRSTLWGVPLENPYTIKAGAKPVKLTEVGRSTVDETGRKYSQEWETKQGMWNEGPFVLKHDGKYYLTYSANYYGSVHYAVGYAVSDNPLSGFVKGENAKIMGCDDKNSDNWDYFNGTGHAMFLTIGSENYFVYHTLIPGKSPDPYRYFTIDTFGFRADGSLYINGPTASAQKVPDVISGLTNVADKATVTVDGGSADKVGYLTDGAVNAGVAHSDAEVTIKDGTITLRFDAPVELSAIVVYNSADFAKMFKSIDSIELNFGMYTIENVKVLSDSYVTRSGQVYAGSAAIVELNHTAPVNEITLKFSGDVAVSEIQVLAKVG